MSIVSQPIISAEALHKKIAEDPSVVCVIDVRTKNGHPGAGLAMYHEAHIPGAIHLDLETDLSAPSGPGRHPLPSVADFVQTLSSAGIGPEQTIICYDNVGGAIAARLWWMLDNIGVDSAYVLNGGLQAWQRFSYPLESTIPNLAPTTWHCVTQRNATVDRDQLSSDPSSFAILDARAAKRFRGEVEPLDLVAGHIPTAISAPFSENLINGLFKSPEQLLARFTALKIPSTSQVVHSCGSGVTACHNILAMRIAGMGPTALYPGSWSDWCRSKLPIATGV